MRYLSVSEVTLVVCCKV